MLFALYVDAQSLHALVKGLRGREGYPAFVVPLASAEILGCVLAAFVQRAGR